MMLKKEISTKNNQNNQIEYQTLFMKAPLPMVIFDSETGLILQANDLFCKLSGYEKQKLIDLSFYETSILQPEQKMKELLRRIQQEDPLPMFTLDFKTADGEKLFVKVDYSTFKVDEKKLVCLTITDTSSQKRILESLKHHLTMERIIMHIATEYINIPLETADKTIEMALGEIARFVEADRAYVFEYHFETGLTTNTLEWCAQGISPEKDHLQKVPLSMVPEWVNQHINGKDMYIENVNQLKKSGLKKVLEAQSIKSLLAVPMMKGKECIGFVGFDSVNNYHGYTQKEKKLLYLFSQLLVNIQMRRELLQAEEEACHLNKAKTEFLSNLSHELRTPLSGITGAIETTLETDINSESRYLLEIALSSSLQLEKIFSDLYEIVKLSNGKTTIQPAVVNPYKLIKEVAGLFKISAEKKKLKLHIRKSHLPETLYTDPKLLRQILDKLVDNAIKFTSSGNVIISADYLQTVRNNGTLILSVSDTGMGIDEETQKKIYDIFFQKDLSLTKEFKGMGLGLPMVSSIIEKMNGKIFLESVEGKGSKFTVRLPVLEHKPK